MRFPLIRKIDPFSSGIYAYFGSIFTHLWETHSTALSDA
jgi:hypothetical protein